MWKTIAKRLLIVPAIGVGVLAFSAMMKGRQAPVPTDQGPAAKPVRVMPVQSIPVMPRAVGYGTVRSGRVWRSVAQVGGRIVTFDERVREGEFFAKGDLLAQIDDTDYKLEVASIEARIAGLEAQLEELNARAGTTRASLAIEQQSLALAEREFARSNRLADQQRISKAERDREERNVLSQRARVQEIENSLALLSPQRSISNAELQREQSNLTLAKLRVTRTRIEAPFACRIGRVEVERNQVIQAGQLLFVADAIDTAEVTAWLPLSESRTLLSNTDIAWRDAAELRQLAEQLGLSAAVEIRVGDDTARWQAVVGRIRGVDERTRSLGIDVVVQDPYARIQPATRPPLVPKLYVRVEVSGETLPEKIVIPRAALHGQTVNVLNRESRLETRKVTTGFTHGGFAVIESGLRAGETLVLTDLVPAIPGTLCSPIVDDAAIQTLRRDARGRREAR